VLREGCRLGKLLILNVREKKLPKRDLGDFG
jgi:hypothetical protein